MTVNDEVLAYVVDKVRTHFPDEVDLVIAYGSHVTGNAGPKSDVDVCLVVNNDRGYQAVENFIIDGVGYDVWAMDWKRLRRIAKLKEHLASIVGLGEIAWAKNHNQRIAFEELRDRMYERLAEPTYTHKRIEDRILDVEDLLPRIWEKGDIGVAREGLAFIVMALGEAVAFENGTFIKHGINNWLQEMESLQLYPRDFVQRLDQVMKSNDEEEILEHGRMAIYHLQKPCALRE